MLFRPLALLISLTLLLCVQTPVIIGVVVQPPIPTARSPPLFHRLEYTLLRPFLALLRRPSGDAQLNSLSLLRLALLLQRSLSSLRTK